jgi:poly(3-hydroxybutyrate) depolymerase
MAYSKYYYVFSFLLFVCGTACDKDLDPLPVVKTYEEQVHVSQKIGHADIQRTAIVRYPKVYTKSSYPIIFVFHPHGKTAETLMQESTELNNLVDEEAFIAIYVKGLWDKWNYGPEASGASETEFMNLLYQEIKHRTRLDTTQAYAIGFAEGACVMNDLAKRQNRFKAIVSVGGQQSNEGLGVEVSTPFSVYQINAQKDTFAPFNGGAWTNDFTFASAQESVLNWAQNMGCSSVTDSVSTTWGTTPITSISYKACTSSHEVQYHIVEDLDSALNFGGDYQFYGKIWDFFQSK